jgi:hypothetical protein
MNTIPLINPNNEGFAFFDYLLLPEIVLDNNARSIN